MIIHLTFRDLLRPRLLPPVVAHGALLATTVFLVAALTREAVAQEQAPSVQTLSAEQFIQRVAAASPRLAITGADIDAAAARVRSAGLWDNPTLAYDREEVFEAGSGRPENYLRLELPLEISGRRSLRVESAEHGVKAARANAKADRVTILADAMRVYLYAAARREHLAILTESRTALATLRDSIKSRASAGDASGYDHARIEIEISSLDDLITDAEGKLVKARLQIGMLFGQPGVQFDAGNALTLQDLSTPSDAQAASGGRTRVVASRHRVTQHSLARDAANRGWVPSLTLSGGAKTAPLAGDTAWGYVAGIGITLPIFDFGQAEKEREEAALRRAQASLALTERQVTTHIAIAQEAFARSLRQAAVFERDQFPRLKKLMRTAAVSYREGERPVFELLDAHRTDREVRQRNVGLKLQARLSRLELLEALGREPGGNP